MELQRKIHEQNFWMGIALDMVVCLFHPGFYLFPVIFIHPLTEPLCHFLFFIKTRELMDDSVTSTATTYSWMRTGPWLPWMKLGTRPGYLLYSGQGKKLKSFDELDPVVRETARKEHPVYLAAPKAFSTPNETSWTYYRKLMPKPAAAAPADKK